MTENETPEKVEEAPVSDSAEHPADQDSKKEPGLLDSVGSFPYWILKAINTVTPDFLRTKEPPKKNYRI